MDTDEQQAYRQLALSGATPMEIAQVAHLHGLGAIEIIRLLRSIFTLEFIEAKELATQAVYGMSLSDYQEKYLLPLFQEFEREGATAQDELLQSGDDRHL
ncbi:hypothetical protein [Deinococcus ficus]|uniref:hypothetical protein n=1 Tax=Deinococcus ficus TaxID=317577 RepID=UPI0003B2FA7C|nr:hypothetical protein [Deinococcus ficus]